MPPALHSWTHRMPFDSLAGKLHVAVSVVAVSTKRHTTVPS